MSNDHVPSTTVPARSKREPGEKQDGFLTALRVQLRCLRAMMIRDMLMRYGRGNLGFLWVLIEPMLLTAGVLLLWSALKGEREHGVQVIAFVLTGYVPLTLWRHMTNNAVMLIRRNASLMYHRKVTVLDIFVARMVLEFAGTTAALVVITGVALTLGLIDPIQDWSLVMAGWLVMGILSFASGLLICGLTEYSEVWERFIQPYQYLMLPVSGCFFLVDWLPSGAQEIAWYMPTVHCFEAFRAGYFGNAVTTHHDLWYPLLMSIGLLTVGLPLLDRAREHMHSG